MVIKKLCPIFLLLVGGGNASDDEKWCCFEQNVRFGATMTYFMLYFDGGVLNGLMWSNVWGKSSKHKLHVCKMI